MGLKRVAFCWVMFFGAVSGIGSSSPKKDFQWLSQGPFLGEYTKVAVIPGSIPGVFAGLAEGGVFYGVPDGNGGINWQEVDNGITDKHINCLATSIDSNSLVTAWVGTDSGLFASSNWQQGWAAALGPTFGRVNTLAICELSANQTVYIFVGTDSGKVFLTQDSGQNWSDISGDLPAVGVSSLDVLPDSPEVVYAGNNQGDLFKSTNRGVDWVKLRDGDHNSWVSAIAITRQYTNTVYIGYSSGGSSGGTQGVYRTTNGGGDWLPLTLAGVSVQSLIIDPLNPAMLYAGCYLASGSTAKAYAGYYFSSGSTSLYKSGDSGVTWLAADSGLSGVSGVQSLAIVSSSASPSSWPVGMVFAGMDNGGVCRTLDGGISWSWHNSGLILFNSLSLAVQPYAEYLVYTADNSGHIYRSFTGGTSWVKTAGNLTPNEVTSLTIEPGVVHSTHPTVYATTYSPDSYGGAIFKSIDGGDNWNLKLSEPSIETSGFNCLALDPSTSSVLYAGGNSNMTGSGTTLYRSTNFGTDWSGAGLHPDSGGTARVQCLAIHPVDTTVIFAGTLGGLFKSINSGSHWDRSGTGLEGKDVLSLAITPKYPNIMYAGVKDGGVYQSVDSGGTWVPMGGDLGAYSVDSLSVRPGSSKTILAGTSGQGVYWSGDWGHNWAPVNTGLWNSDVRVVTFHPAQPELAFAATYGGGVFYRWFLYDLDLDGVLGESDLILMMGLLSGATPARLDEAAADINGDEKIDALDLVLIMVELNSPA